MNKDRKRAIVKAGHLRESFCCGSIRDNGAYIRLRTGQVARNREGDLRYDCFKVFVSKSSDGFDFKRKKKHIYSLSLFFLFFFEGLISSFISITLAPGNSLIRKMSAFQDDPLLFHPKGQDALNYGVELSY